MRMENTDVVGISVVLLVLREERRAHLDCHRPDVGNSGIQTCF